MINGKKMLVVSAHAADYVRRAGGTIAKYIKHGAEVHLVVLSFGGRGESNDLWKQPGATAESVKAVRRAETEAAADILGIKNIEFWDLQDYPIVTDDALTDRLVGKIRLVRPDIILTHDRMGADVLNPDHNHVSRCSNAVSLQIPPASVRRACPTPHKCGCMASSHTKRSCPNLFPAPSWTLPRPMSRKWPL